MTQKRQPPAGKAGRGDEAGHVPVRRGQHTASRTHPRPAYKPVFAQPPAVAPRSRACHAPDLICLFVGDDWQSELESANNELEQFGETTPALALPLNTDPLVYRWLVSGRQVLIYGAVERATLRRLLAALLRDGALAVAGEDLEGVLHTAIKQKELEAL